MYFTLEYDFPLLFVKFRDSTETFLQWDIWKGTHYIEGYFLL